MKVSVVMAVYNGDRYLQEAIESILNQTFTDFEFILIDDGSTDATESILTAYAKQDSRILVSRNNENMGLPRSLNKGLALAQGEYVARMDADDISLPKRFAKQVAFMDAHPEVGVCGTWLKTIGEAPGYEQYPVEDKTIRAWLLFDSALAHPSVMMRRKLFVQENLHYDPAYKYCQDYELWGRASTKFLINNLPEYLIIYRVHPQQMGQSYSEQLRLSEIKNVQQIQLHNLSIKPTDEDLDLHLCFKILRFSATKEFFKLAHGWLEKLKAENEKSSAYDQLALTNILGYRWYLLCQAATNLGWSSWETFWQSPFSASTNLSWQQKLKFAIKCGIKWKGQI